MLNRIKRDMLAGAFLLTSVLASAATVSTVVPPNLSRGIAGTIPGDISGLGWQQTGLPTITRCKRTLTTDGVIHPFDLMAADAYCLYGERLIKISGTDRANSEFRAEVKSFQRVKSFGSDVAVGTDLAV